MIDYESLRPYAQTPTEIAVLDALKAHGSQPKAAKHLGRTRSAVNDALSRIRHRRSLKDANQHQDRQVPDGYTIKGVSTLYDENGNKRAEWVKSDLDKERLETLQREAILALKDEITP